MHFYAGPAEYREAGAAPYRVFLNENTIRDMDPSFAGRPVFVQHVEQIESELSELKKAADGWVVESFYNKADGKHWVKFIVVSDIANQKIKNGWRLSNCYIPKSFGPGGVWNGIDYQKEIRSGTFEHLAIVQNPRYEESVILSPEEYKKYNSDKDVELIRLANNKRELPVKFNFFKREKVENSFDLETMSVELPQSKVEVSLKALINAADKEEMDKEKPKIAEKHHLVDCMGNTMSVNELVQKHEKMCDEMEEMKKPKEEEKNSEKDSSEDQDMETAKKEPVKSADEKAGEKADKPLEKEEKMEVKDEMKKKNDLEASDRLANAEYNSYLQQAAHEILLPSDRVAIGKARYGSN